MVDVLCPGGGGTKVISSPPHRVLIQKNSHRHAEMLQQHGGHADPPGLEPAGRARWPVYTNVRTRRARRGASFLCCMVVIPADTPQRNKCCILSLQDAAPLSVCIQHPNACFPGPPTPGFTVGEQHRGASAFPSFRSERFLFLAQLEAAGERLSSGEVGAASSDSCCDRFLCSSP